MPSIHFGSSLSQVDWSWGEERAIEIGYIHCHNLSNSSREAYSPQPAIWRRNSLSWIEINGPIIVSNKIARNKMEILHSGVILYLYFWLGVGCFAYTTFHFWKLSSASLEVVWRFQWKAFNISSFRVNLVLACQEVLNEFGPQWTEIGSPSFKFKHLRACSTSGK